MIPKHLRVQHPLIGSFITYTFGLKKCRGREHWHSLRSEVLVSCITRGIVLTVPVGLIVNERE